MSNTQKAPETLQELSYDIAYKALHELHGDKDVRKFREYVENAVSNLTTPAEDAVMYEAVSVEKDLPKDRDFYAALSSNGKLYWVEMDENFHESRIGNLWFSPKDVITHWLRPCPNPTKVNKELEQRVKGLEAAGAELWEALEYANEIKSLWWCPNSITQNTDEADKRWMQALREMENRIKQALANTQQFFNLKTEDDDK